MDKSGSIAKAIVSAPTFAPVRQVEYGCEHIEHFMSASADGAEKLVSSYAHLNSLLSKPLETQTSKDPKDTKKVPTTTLKPTFLCLQCAAVCSREERDAHCKNRKHQFSVESRSGCLWCGQCEDFVYDPGFERIRVGASFPTASGKKRKLYSIYPQGEEDKFVLPNSNTLSCQAGAPRGIYNLGLTCYLSVILQAMVHNPLLRNYFLSSRHDTADCKQDNCVACALTASFTDILATEKLDGHGPVDMLHKSWTKKDSLSGYQQQDAHEYFQELLDHLHVSSGCVKNGRETKTCECLYHQIFFGTLRSTITCGSCRNQTVTEDPIVDLSLDLRQQANKRRKLSEKDAKGSSGKHSTTEDAPLELTQCLKSFTTPEKLAADSYNCRSKECGHTPQRARKHLTVRKLPPTLCIQLKRYEQTKQNAHKLDTKLNFPLQLDMTPYTTRSYTKRKKGLASRGGDTAIPDVSEPVGTAPLAARSPGWYDLSTIVVHIGKIDAGHYVCYCRRDEQWFRFDDNKVTPASEAQVLEQEAYLLFYVIRSLGGITEKEREAEAEREKEREAEQEREREAERENGNADAEGEDDD